MADLAAVHFCLMLFARRQKGKAAHQDWVFQNGIKGRATATGVSSPATVNEMPLLSLNPQDPEDFVLVW
jgi:hypothetical protein